ncbi:hypothetical protein CRV08_10930 [Halarcobacter ebronensis]|uniref:SPOR domain-containing protein n=1 Tax=Halarcobacter ebronensis TaxID=1462615 RepID=A0A4Q0YDG7_9BACT|nr:TolC family protein [Halarcobacter ebronensis]RXJ67099.1 hypothetical protein CRV08_10930 [Halarcobacter ebronensis]
MKKHIISLVVSSILCTSVLNATSLKDAVEQTISSNPDVLSEKFNKDAYRKYVDEERSDYYPKIDFSGYFEDSTTRYDRDDRPTDPTKEDKDGWNAQLTIEQILYDGGLTPSQVQENIHLYNGNRYRSNRRVEEIIRGTVDSYMNLVEYQELLNLSENNLKLHDDYLIMAKDKESISGEILESYQVNAKKHYITDNLLEQKDQQNQAKNKYLKFTQTATDGNICRPVIDESLIPNKIEKMVEIATLKNTKVLEQIEKIKEQRENLQQAKSSYLPTLKLQWQGVWNDDLEEPENGRQDIQRTRLILDWNLFEGGRTYHTTQREKLFLQEQQKVLDNTIAEVEEEIKSKYDSYFIAKQRVVNMRKYIVDNRNIRDVYLKQLQDGTRTFIDILDAESELYRSEISALQLEMDMYGKYFDILQDIDMLTESILKSKDQACKVYIPKKYENPIKREKFKDNSELKDKDLLNELGMDADKTLDNEINKLLNSEPVKEEKIEKPIEKTLPDGEYTINLTTLSGKEYDIATFKEKYGLSSDKSLYTYNTDSGTNVIYGGYKTLEDANKAMEELTNKGIDLKIYVDFLKKHKELLEKFKNIN